MQRQSGPEFSVLMSRISKIQQSDLAFCIISFHEQALGCNAFLARAKSPADVVRGYRMLDRILATFAAANVLPYHGDAATEYDSLFAGKLRLGTMDLRIASIALSNRLTLLTRNFRDFRKIPNLVIADWTQ